MKLCALQWMIALTFASASVAHNVTAQILDQEISISLSGVPFEEALQRIQDLTNVKFFYSPSQLTGEGPVTLQVEGGTLGEVLEGLLRPRRIEYKVYEKERTVTLRKRSVGDDSGQSSLEKKSRFASSKKTLVTITGKVTDVNGQPMAGVNIVIKGTMRGTTTDASGKYTIDANDGDILVFSFIGYASLEQPVDSRSVINVVLIEDIFSLKDVVINAGYYTVTKAVQTGNIARVTAEDIGDQPVPNVLMAIQGRMPGVVITQTSGVPGSGMTLQIRGQNSLRTYNPASGVPDANRPLFVIDGVPIATDPIPASGGLLSASTAGIDPLNTIDPSNIESIEILKDADATAIYGSRGANGVVLITTKKGKEGVTDINIQAYHGAGRVSKMMDLMNTEQYLSMRKEAFLNDGVLPGSGDYDLNGMWDQTAYTDWQQMLFGGWATISDVQGSMSGGSEHTSFRLGGGFHREGTVFPGDFGYGKGTGFLNINHQAANDKLRISLSVNYGQDKHRLFDMNIASYALTLPPNAPLYDDAGALDWTGYTGFDNANPMSYFNTTHTSQTGNLISSAVLSYQIGKNLKVATNFGFNEMHADQFRSRPQSSLHPASSVPSTSIVQKNSQKNWIIEPQLNYWTNIGRGRLDALIGATWQSNTSTNLELKGEGYVSDALLGNVQSATTKLILSDEEFQYRYNALFGRLAYNWMDKYVLNLTARRDGSSRFGPENQFGNFWAVGIGWVFSQEDFVRQGMPFLSFGKLRASYGTTGNDRIGDYGYLSTYSVSLGTYGGIPILNTTALSNPDFAWEVNKKLEAGLDLGFIEDRIQFDVTWYRNRSSNQLVGYPLPATAGFTIVQYNLDATVENTGWEFELRGAIVERGKFRWRTTMNLTIPKNRLVSYPNLAGSSYANRYVVGEPLSISKRYEFIGVDAETGLYQVADLDQSGSFSTTDRQALVDLSRKYYGGLQSAITFGPFHFGLSIEFVKQKASDYMTLFSIQPGGMSNQLASVLSQRRWSQEGDQADMQKFTQALSSAYTRAAISTLSLTDASYLRLKTISLSYDLPTKWIERLKLRKIRVHVHAQNILTLTDYFGFNPEYPYLELPPLRVFTGGIQLKF